jgi:hypothetical protein
MLSGGLLDQSSRKQSSCGSAAGCQGKQAAV